MISCCRCATDSFSCTWWARAESSFGDQHWRKFEACQKKNILALNPNYHGKVWAKSEKMERIDVRTVMEYHFAHDNRMRIHLRKGCQFVLHKKPNESSSRDVTNDAIIFWKETPFWTDSILLIQVAEEWFDQFLDWLWKGLAAGNGRSHGITWMISDVKVQYVQCMIARETGLVC